MDIRTLTSDDYNCFYWLTSFISFQITGKYPGCWWKTDVFFQRLLHPSSTRVSEASLRHASGLFLEYSLTAFIRLCILSLWNLLCLLLFLWPGLGLGRLGLLNFIFSLSKTQCLDSLNFLNTTNSKLGERVAFVGRIHYQRTPNDMTIVVQLGAKIKLVLNIFKNPRIQSLRATPPMLSILASCWQQPGWRRTRPTATAEAGSAKHKTV